MSPDETSDLRIAHRLKEIRLSRGLTLTQLAGAVEMSSAHLSRIETGERQPSVGALIQLARAHGMSLSRLVGEDDGPTHHVVRRGEGVVQRSANGPCVALSGPFAGLEALQIDLAPTTEALASTHHGEEWLYVLDGSADLLLNGTTVHLDTGDACHFNASLTHELRCGGDTSSRVLLVSTASRAAHAVANSAHARPEQE